MNLLQSSNDFYSFVGQASRPYRLPRQDGMPSRFSVLIIRLEAMNEKLDIAEQSA
jgi:hypothetical protein